MNADKTDPESTSSTPLVTEHLLMILDILKEEYSPWRLPLNFRSPFELMVSVSLSAQTTDAAVNRVTPELFRRWPNPQTLARADPQELEVVIHSVGFFRQKARNLIGAATRLVEVYGGKLPCEMEDLTSLPGIGRKCANVIRSQYWNLPGITVDTHFGRVCRRLGLTEETDPTKVEYNLGEQIPVERWNEFSMTANFHGRRYCMSRKPNCQECPLNEICPKCGVTSI